MLAVGKFGQDLSRLSAHDRMEYTLNCVTLFCCMLAGLESHQIRDCCGYEQRLPLCWTEEAATWISQQLGLLVLHVAGMVFGIALC
jgi:hypothetical protein